MRNSTRPTLGMAVAVLAWAFLTTSAGAAVIPVTTTADGLFDDGECGLREAITATNSNGDVNGPDDCDHNGVLEPDTITVPASGTPYELDQTAPGAENGNLEGDLDVNTATATAGDLTIDGAGAAATTIDTDDAPAWDERVLHHFTAAGTLTVSDLTITDGNEAGDGGGILNAGGSLFVNGVRVTANTSIHGGGIATQTPSTTSLSIVDSTIDNNTATGLLGSGGVFSNATTTTVDSTVILGNTATSPTSAPNGGGMEAASTTLTMTDSVVADNHLIDSAGADAVIAGGGLKISAGSATIRGTTFSDNEVTGGAVNQGGGIETTGNLALINSTLSANESLGALSDAGGLFVNSGTTNVIQTTFGPNPTGDDGSAIFNNGVTVNVHGSVIETSGATDACFGTITSTDDNVVTDTSCFMEAGNDDTDADPELGALLDNGGPDAGAPGSLEGIFTHALALTSTAVDHVPTGDCDDELAAPLLVDQRAVTRPQGPACDAGAFEREYRLLTAAKAGSGSGTVTGTGINCGGDCTESFIEGAPAVVLTATADAGSTFTGWTGCDSPSGNQCTQTVSGGNETVTATFTANRLLTVAKAGTGSGMVTGTGINCGGDCSETVLDGTAVVLTAAADAGSTFAGWTGCDNPVGNQCTQTVTGGNETVTANFTVNPPPTQPTPLTPVTTAPDNSAECAALRAKLKKAKSKRKKKTIRSQLRKLGC